jgi:sugar fermentation stimulation protein A
MRFPSPLQRGVLVQRYKRFFADVVLETGEAVTAHCPNPGAMLGLNQPGMPVWVSRSDSPTRKLAHTLELVEAEDGLVGVNTHRPNGLAAEALAAGAVPELAGYAGVRREVRYGLSSRVDFLLEEPGRPRCWLEIKNCHFMREPGLAEFPDCEAARSLKHLRELTAQVQAGDRAVLLFVIQRGCERFAAAGDIDPAYAAGLQEAAKAGVEVLCYVCEIDTDGVRVARRVPWRDAPGS